MKQTNRHSIARIAVASFASAMLILLCCMTGCVSGGTENRGASAENHDMNAEDISYEPSAEEKLDAAIDAKISSMDLHDKVAQMVVVRPEAINDGNMYSFTSEGTENLAEYPFGGVCYFSENLSEPEVLTSAVSAMQDAAKRKTEAGIGMFVAVDEEGGGLAYPNAVAGVGGTQGISRIAKAGFPDSEKLYPMFYYKDDGDDVAYDNASTIARYLKEYGFNWDYAPVADVNSNPDNPIIGYRAYSDDWSETASLVASAVRGYEGENMATSLKHFPGHGDTKTDSHLGAAAIDDKDYYQILSQELVPFKAGIAAGADSVMMGHITIKTVDDMPASMSKYWVQNVLRDELGFDGVVITDGLEMGALTNNWSNSDIAIMCTKAGCDVLLLPEDPYGAVDAVVEAVAKGEIEENQIDASVKRILEMKARHGIWDVQE